MTVVCNTSPITNLAAIAQLDLLRQLYGEIVIPQAVYDELTVLPNPVPGTVEVQTLLWVRVHRVVDQALVADFRRTVDLGEAEGLALALEVSAERVLIDDAAGRVIARHLVERSGEARNIDFTCHLRLGALYKIRNFYRLFDLAITLGFQI